MREIARASGAGEARKKKQGEKGGRGASLSREANDRAPGSMKNVGSRGWRCAAGRLLLAVREYWRARGFFLIVMFN